MAVRKRATTPDLLVRARAAEATLREAGNAQWAAIGAPPEYFLTEPDEDEVQSLAANPDWLAEIEHRLTIAAGAE